MQVEIGKTRPDSARNVWAKMQVRPPDTYGPEWVVVHVAHRDGQKPAWDVAREWIETNRPLLNKGKLPGGDHEVTPLAS